MSTYEHTVPLSDVADGDTAHITYDGDTYAKKVFGAPSHRVKILGANFTIDALRSLGASIVLMREAVVPELPTLGGTTFTARIGANTHPELLFVLDEGHGQNVAYITSTGKRYRAEQLEADSVRNVTPGALRDLGSDTPSPRLRASLLSLADELAAEQPDDMSVAYLAASTAQSLRRLAGLRPEEDA